MSDAHLGYMLAVLATLCWGGIVISIRKARVPGNLGVGISLPAGFLALLPASLLTHVPFPSWQTLAAPATVYAPWNLTLPKGLCIVLSGIFLFPVATICYYDALRSAEVSVIAPLKCVKAILLVGLVALLGYEPLTPTVVIAAIIGVAGAAVLTRSPRKAAVPTQPTADGHTYNLARGVVMALLTCLFWSLGELLMGFAAGRAAGMGANRVPAIHATPMAILSGGVVYYTYMLARGRAGAIFRMDRTSMKAFALHGVVSFGIAYAAFFGAMRFLGVTRAVVVTNTWPLVAFGIGLFLYRESFTWRKFVGVVLLFASFFLIFSEKEVPKHTGSSLPEEKTEGPIPRHDSAFRMPRKPR